MITVDLILRWFICMDFPGGLFVGSPTFLALCLGTLKFHPLLVFRECFSWPPKNLSFFGPRSDFWVLVGSTHLGKILRDMVIFPLRLVTFPRYFCFPMYPVTFERNLLWELKASIFAGLTQPRSFSSIYVNGIYILQFMTPLFQFFCLLVKGKLHVPG